MQTAIAYLRASTAEQNLSPAAQREAIEAAGHFIPLVVENVRGAQKWVGRSRWNYGSFHLWGDVPALMPIAKARPKVSTMGAGWYPPGHPKHVPGLAFNTHAERNLGEGVKAGDRNKARSTGGHKWTTSFAEHSRSSARKAASAMIAKIPPTLARHIAREWHP